VIDGIAEADGPPGRGSLGLRISDKVKTALSGDRVAVAAWSKFAVVASPAGGLSHEGPRNCLAGKSRESG